jgi:hypothetical protein
LPAAAQPIGGIAHQLGQIGGLPAELQHPLLDATGIKQVGGEAVQARHAAGSTFR